MRTEPYGVISRTLVRTDRNGTKYYTGIAKCDRCGGLGGGNQWEYTGWTCYKCGGKGQYATEWCERTDEYQQKLDTKRVEREAKKLAEQKANEAEIIKNNMVRNCANSEKAIATCNGRKGHGCETCEHRSYCSLLCNVIYTFEDGEKMEILTDAQKGLYETLKNIDKSEPVRIETLAGEPCIEGRWFTNAYGSSTRCITKPNGEKVYTSATTDRGLAKHGLRNRR